MHLAPGLLLSLMFFLSCSVGRSFCLQSPTFLRSVAGLSTHAQQFGSPRFLSSTSSSLNQPSPRSALSSATDAASPQASTGGLRRLPVLSPSNELLSRSVKQSYNAVKPDSTIKNARMRSRKFGAIKVTHLTQSLCAPLRTIVQAYRKELYALHPFERVVADLTVRARQKKDGLTLSALLDEIDDARKQILTAGKSFAQACKVAASSDEALTSLSSSEESLSSLFTLLASPPLDRLLSLQRSLRAVPSVNLSSPCCVLVGSPNVGKSSLVGVLSSARPEIADYPFTTRGVTLGHVLLPPRSSSPSSPPTKCQVMDSPGLLPRADETRNEMEDLTLAAMRHLPTGVVFVLDLSGLAGDKCSSIEGQLEVRREVRTKFPNRPWIDVVSKVDLGIDEAGRTAVETMLQEEARRTGGKKRELIEVSVKEGTGLDTLRMEVKALLEQVGVVLEALNVEEGGSEKKAE